MTNLQNPRTEKDGTVIWDCIYFGHYPQSSDGNGGFNNDPIKWRVLSVEGDEALLLADQNLDAKLYNETYANVTWETSTIRSWLNGYGADSNKNGNDYSSDNFMGKAFASGEQAAINQKTIQNPDNPCWNTEGGNDTTDKVFLLSIDEVTKPAYGFPSDCYEESKTREALNTAYTASKDGMYDEGSSDYWWLRSPGSYSSFAADVLYYGYVFRIGTYVYDHDRAIRPALFLNLKSDHWSYAGTVSSEGKEKEGRGAME